MLYVCFFKHGPTTPLCFSVCLCVRVCARICVCECVVTCVLLTCADRCVTACTRYIPVLCAVCRLVEGDIFRIGMHLEDIKETIDRNVCSQLSPPHSSSTPTSVPPMPSLGVNPSHPHLSAPSLPSFQHEVMYSFTSLIHVLTYTLREELQHCCARVRACAQMHMHVCACVRLCVCACACSCA